MLGDTCTTGMCRFLKKGVAVVDSRHMCVHMEDVADHRRTHLGVGKYKLDAPATRIRELRLRSWDNYVSCWPCLFPIAATSKGLEAPTPHLARCATRA